MTWEAFCNPYSELTQGGKKPEIPEQVRKNRRAARGDAKRKRSFVLDMGRKRHNQVKTQRI